MRLCEHPDFGDILIAVANERGISEQIAEKDYYVTEALRIVAAELGEWGLFKGGTSLSKGWGLIERFSEDIDLFVNPVASEYLNILFSSRSYVLARGNPRSTVATGPAMGLADIPRARCAMLWRTINHLVDHQRGQSIAACRRGSTVKAFARGHRHRTTVHQELRNRDGYEPRGGAGGHLTRTRRYALAPDQPHG